jgi:hypothetical protein
MKTSLIFATLVFTLFTMAFPLAGRSEDGGWHMPNLNPFSAKTKPPVAGRASPATSGWHPPKLFSKPAPPKRTAAQPSAWSKMTSGTQKFFSKTADALNPWDSKQPEPPPKLTGSNSVFTRNHAKAEPKSSSIVPTSWWSSEPEDPKNQRPKTVNDFLSQERPR